MSPSGLRFSHSLQWGHALSGMDTTSQHPLYLSDSESFNGAMPFQAWIPHTNDIAARE